MVVILTPIVLMVVGIPGYSFPLLLGRTTQIMSHFCVNSLDFQTPHFAAMELWQWLLAEVRKKPSYFPSNTGCLMTGSLFHGL